MNISHLLRCAALAAILGAVVPAAAEAQLGGALRAVGNRVKDRVEQTAPGTADSPTASGAAASPAGAARGAGVLEITSEVLDRLAQGLSAETAERTEVARLLAALPTREQHSQCQAQLFQSPEALALADRFQAELARHENNPTALQEALVRQGEAMNQLTESKCGPDPSQQQEQRRALQSRPEAAGARAGGFTVDNASHYGTPMVSREYAILKERVLPFCQANAPIDANGGVRIPAGSGSRASLAYSAAEVQALQPRCGSLLPALQATL